MIPILKLIAVESEYSARKRTKKYAYWCIIFNSLKLIFVITNNRIRRISSANKINPLAVIQKRKRQRKTSHQSQNYNKEKVSLRRKERESCVLAVLEWNKQTTNPKNGRKTAAAICKSINNMDNANIYKVTVQWKCSIQYLYVHGCLQREGTHSSRG